MSNTSRRDDSRENDEGGGWGVWAGIGTAAVAAAAGGLLYYLKGNRTSECGLGNSIGSSRSSPQPTLPRTSSTTASSAAGSGGVIGYLSNMLNSNLQIKQLSDDDTFIDPKSIPQHPHVTNLNSLLADIHVRYIAIKKNEFQRHFKVFTTVFDTLHETMQRVDPFYNRYSSTVYFAGSHYDRLRIKKPDEFDMDVVINLPVNFKINSIDPRNSDIVLDPIKAGFLQLLMGEQFKKLPMRDEWAINKAAYKWMDSSGYLLRSNFIAWFESVVNIARNQLEQDAYGQRIIKVDGVNYVIGLSKSGPAITLKISGHNFNLDVDLVPALRFPESRWPISSTYRNIPPGCSTGWWMVVPKPNKNSQNDTDMSRSWRLSLHNQERELLHNTYNLRSGIRFLKKLRDALGMKKIASYYIKTLFLWELVERNDPHYWSRSSYATIFKDMVKKFHDALEEGRIPYFWNRRNNLLEGIDRATLTRYAGLLRPLLAVLDQPCSYREVAKYLLTGEEYKDFSGRVFLW